MKNNKFIKALLAVLAAFMLYSANLHRVQNAKLQIIKPQVQKKKVQQKEPQITAKNAPHKNMAPVAGVKSKAGSQKSLVKTIEKIMGQQNYQVAVQNLNNSSKYAVVYTNQKPQKVKAVLKLYLLAAIYKEEQTGKLNAQTTIKIKKRDKAKHERYLTTNMMYGIQYLRQAAMKNNQTAINALVRKISLKKINQVAQAFGTKQTVIHNDLSGTTSAEDLDLTLKGLYQGRVLKRQYAQRLLMAMHAPKLALTSQINGTIYGIGDKQASAVIVQTAGQSYSIAVIASGHLAQLGKSVNVWAQRH